MLTTDIFIPVDRWKLLGIIFWHYLYFLLFLFVSKTTFFPIFYFALIPPKFTYPPYIKSTLINIKVASSIAVILCSLVDVCSCVLFEFI